MHTKLLSYVSAKTSKYLDNINSDISFQDVTTSHGKTKLSKISNTRTISSFKYRINWNTPLGVIFRGVHKSQSGHRAVLGGGALTCLGT